VNFGLISLSASSTVQRFHNIGKYEHGCHALIHIANQGQVIGNQFKYAQGRVEDIDQTEG